MRLEDEKSPMVGQVYLLLGSILLAGCCGGLYAKVFPVPHSGF